MIRELTPQGKASLQRPAVRLRAQLWTALRHAGYGRGSIAIEHVLLANRQLRVVRAWMMAAYTVPRLMDGCLQLCRARGHSEERSVPETIDRIDREHLRNDKAPAKRGELRRSIRGRWFVRTVDEYRPTSCIGKSTDGATSGDVCHSGGSRGVLRTTLDVV